MAPAAVADHAPGRRHLRLRLRGVVADAGRDEIIRSWLDLLPAETAAQIDHDEYFA